MLNIVSWTGTITSILGAFFMAFGHTKIGYIMFTFGSMLWLIIGITRKDRSLAVLNGTFLTANIIGLFRSFI